MSWQLPSLSALRVFEAATRHLSFTRAATELNLTQSAVSRQIRQMENYLGVLLFQRVNKTLILTEAGRSYVADIRACLDQMSAATVNLLANKGRGGLLNLASPPAFCSKWLIPRLDRFSSQHPGIMLNISTRAKPFDFNAERFDMAIHYGRNDWPDVIADRLLGEELVVVCSREYAKKNPPLTVGPDLQHHVLLQQTTRYNRWSDWLRFHGVPGVNAWAGPRFEHVYMVMQAAVAGLGLALLPRVLVVDEVALGRLVNPFGDTFVVEDAYFLVYPAAKKSDPKLEIFREWVLNEAAE
ncbi:LysR family transcriptional regulator [Burkholderia sp. WAC0059]|uniref:transcriptional regulator GcvA n=1 Tax=Burkholderia sp. WAC0059 TaxID=2066022 RepID=UPI000C7F5249|nr:transcriptional regulator GcvA [Burkholderia sp. WAC0059]PLZ02663.1 LysR family transcriptional regulator [Burkholderia sp. WAC0059]